MTKKQQIEDLTAEIRALELEPVDGYYTQGEKNRDLDELRTKRAILIASL